MTKNALSLISVRLTSLEPTKFAAVVQQVEPPVPERHELGEDSNVFPLLMGPGWQGKVVSILQTPTPWDVC